MIVFEGRDGAGKGGTIRAMTERAQPACVPGRGACRRRPTARRPRSTCSDTCSTSPRRAKSSSSIGAGTTAPASSTSWVSAREKEHERFLELCPQIEKFLIEGGIILIKLWLEVSNEEQKRRFEARIEDPVRQWKLSPMDLPSRTRWYDYSRARDIMLKKTDTRIAPWYIVRSDDKKTARLNTIAHLLSRIPHKKLKEVKVKLPKRSSKGAYDDDASIARRRFVRERY